ncbi:MAG TPA: hypothetical protein VLF91_05085 [Candidatus Saccharimonadales bacterium]|nr:hypothetical protein [Candidatus Saccharimonadales bacterium]
MSELSVHPNAEMVTVPAAQLDELLAAVVALTDRVAALEAQQKTEPPTPEAVAHPLLPQPSLAAYAASLACPRSAQLYSAAAHEASQPPAERIDELTLKGELLAGIEQLIAHHKTNFESALGPHAATVKKRPPMPDAADPKKVYRARHNRYMTLYEAYFDTHTKTYVWTEKLPGSSAGEVEYSVSYLPAQTKVDGSVPELLSFAVTMPGADDTQVPEGFTPHQQKLTCKFERGRPLSYEAEDIFWISNWNSGGSFKELTFYHKFWLRDDRIGLYQYADGRTNYDDMRYPKSHSEYLYDDQRRTFVSTDSDKQDMSPKEFLALLAKYVNRIPTCNP